MHLNYNALALICSPYTAALHGVHTNKVKASISEYETTKKEIILFNLSHYFV